jgi:ABC-type lipoprotein export system ATPase subunit
MALIKGLNREGKTVIIITHEKEIAQKARRIITVKDGKIVSDIKTKSLDDKRGIKTILKSK